MYKLPQEVRNIIAEFNADHRGQMKSVFQDLKMETVCCSFCSCHVKTNRKHKGEIMCIHYKYCSQHCNEEFRNLILLLSSAFVFSAYCIFYFISNIYK
jgi:hypothetical protein